MRCAWKELLAVLPAWMREEVDVLGKKSFRSFGFESMRRRSCFCPTGIGGSTDPFSGRTCIIV